MRVATPSQTVGPYFSIGLDPLKLDTIAAPGIAGERVTIHGRMVDGDGKPVPDAVLEIWQADASGKYTHPEAARKGEGGQEFFGYGRIPTNDHGEFRFTTIKPGSVPAPDGTMQAPHLEISIFMRGLLNRLVTRIYFPGEAENAQDFALKRIDPARRETLIARRSPAEPSSLEWNVTLQGPSETVFFDI